MKFRIAPPRHRTSSKGEPIHGRLLMSSRVSTPLGESLPDIAISLTDVNIEGLMAALDPIFEAHREVEQIRAEIAEAQEGVRVRLRQAFLEQFRA